MSALFSERLEEQEQQDNSQLSLLTFTDALNMNVNLLTTGFLAWSIQGTVVTGLKGFFPGWFKSACTIRA